MLKLFCESWRTVFFPKVRAPLVFDSQDGPTYRPFAMHQLGEFSSFDEGHSCLPGLRLLSVGLGLTLVLSTSLVFAQSSEGLSEDAAPVSGETDVETVDKDAVERRGLSFGNVNAAAVPVEEKRERVEQMLVEQRQALAQVTEILAEARNSKDIVQLNCVNEKLTQIKGLLKISEQASLQMYEAIASNAQDLVNHEYTKVVVAHQKGQTLRSEAEQCVGEDSVYAGETLVDVEIDNPDGLGDPTTVSTPPPGPVVPPVASTF